MCSVKVNKLCTVLVLVIAVNSIDLTVYWTKLSIMTLFNLCFCQHDGQFYIFKNSNRSNWDHQSTINCYHVNSLNIFQYSILLHSGNSTVIACSNITQVFPFTINIDISIVTNKPVQVNILRNFQTITMIGQCVVKSYNEKANANNQLKHECDSLRNINNICLNQIESFKKRIVRLQLHLHNTQMQVEVNSHIPTIVKILIT